MHRSFLSRVEMHLVRGPHFPDGSLLRGIAMIAPLDRSYRLDPDVWETARSDCRVRRFWAGMPDRFGRLVYASISQASAWLVQFDGPVALDAAFGSRLAQESLAPGYLVSFADAEQDFLYRVARVDNARPGDEP